MKLKLTKTRMKLQQAFVAFISCRLALSLLLSDAGSLIYFIFNNAPHILHSKPQPAHPSDPEASGQRNRTAFSYLDLSILLF